MIGALTKGNTINPSGNVRLGDFYPAVPSNAMVKDIRDLGQIPLKTGAETVYLRDIESIEDAADLMTLGGLALAVGILVDEATVEIENIHTQMGTSKSIALAVWNGNHQTAIPRLLAMLCILAVFVPTFFMQGAPRELFYPLSLAVGFAMIGSYILSSTLVPILCIWLLKDNHAGKRAETRKFFLTAWFDKFASQFPNARFSFEPSDIISDVMSFGSSTPVEKAQEALRSNKRLRPADLLYPTIGLIRNPGLVIRCK